MNHTPGPWTSERMTGGCVGQYLIKSNDGRLAQVLDMHSHMISKYYEERAGDNPTAANARLIAAAPDLMEALRITQPHLREYVDYHNKREGCSTEMEYACDMVEAAIAKAEVQE